MPAKKKTKEEKAAERQKLTAEFFTDFLQKVPEESREYVTKLAEAASQNPEASDFVAEHTMRLADFSRGHNDLQQQHASLEEAKQRSESIYRDNVAWHAENKAAYDRMATQLDHYKRLATADLDAGDLTPGDGGDPSRPPNGDATNMPGYVKAEDVQKLLEERDRGAMEYEAMMADLRHRHEKSFSGEFLDTRELVTHATKRGIRLVDAYDEVYGDRLREKTEVDLEARITKERKEAADEARQEVLRDSQALPYPVRDNEPTSIDYLTMTDKPETGVKAAIDDYYKMQQDKRG